MNDKIYTDVERRHDFVLLFDVVDGNPNGDPELGNLPRVDPETMQGLVTDVALKRKVRNWVDATRGSESRYKIYVQSGEALNNLHRRAYEELGIRSTGTRQNRADVSRAREWMCRNFFDVRTFGAVMSTGVNCGQVRGPIQLTFARSVDPVLPLDMSITRVTVTRGEDTVASILQNGGSELGPSQSTTGRKALVPYGLYRAHGFFNPHFAAQTGVDGEDMETFWNALMNMWELDRSAARGLMSCQGVYIFSHVSRFGNAPAHSLFERVRIEVGEDVSIPRSFSDYRVRIHASEMPRGVSLTRLVG